AAARHVERTSSRTIHFMDEIDQTHRVILGGLEYHGAGSVAEDHAGGAVGVIDDRGHHVRSDHHDFLVGTGGNKLSAGLQGVHEGGASRGEIKSPGSFCAQLVLHQAGGGGE